MSARAVCPPVARVVACVAALWAAAAPAAAAAQTLATRVAAAPDGRAVVTYAARPDACGDGGDVVSVRGSFTASGSAQLHGWLGTGCVHGPAQLVLTVRGGAVVGLHVRVGRARAAPAGASDWGTVSAADAATTALALAPRLTERAAQQAVVAAAVADAPDVWRGLLALARADAAPDRVRQRALHWLGAVAPPEAIAPIAAIARATGERRALREAALSGLALAADGAGAPTLVGLSRGGDDAWLRGKAIFWLGQADDAGARAALRALAAGDTVETGARAHAIFALGHGRADPEAGAFLRALYPRLASAELREKVIAGGAQSDDEANWRWLLDVAANEREPLAVRKQALFWAGQQESVPVARLVAVYPALRGAELRTHYAFVLSQRDEAAAVDALIDLARRDADAAVRRQALFWLGQSESPRAQQYLVEVLER